MEPKVETGKAVLVGVTAEQLNAWKAQHGAILVINACGRTFVFRRPSWEDVSAYTNRVAGTVSRGEEVDVAGAGLTLALDLMLAPARDAFGVLMTEHPLLPVLLTNKVLAAFDVKGVEEIKNW